MTSAISMDRLICGDVGFGKTEVAMQASFIAINAGKQVAVLVPTTLLANQHFQIVSGQLGNEVPCFGGLLELFEPFPFVRGAGHVIRDVL